MLREKEFWAHWIWRRYWLERKWKLERKPLGITLQTSQKESNNRIPFTLTFHPHNNAVKSITLKDSKLLQNDPDTGRIFSQPPLTSFKRDKTIGNFLVRSAFQTSDQPGTFKWASARCKTCPFICNVEKLSGRKRSIKITDHFTCTSANVIYCITCTLCKKLYIGETGRRLGDRFREHLRDVESRETTKTHLNRSLDTLRRLERVFRCTRARNLHQDARVSWMNQNKLTWS